MLALFILSLITILTAPVINSLRGLLKETKVYYQDEIGVYQLQIELAVNDILSVDSDQIIYRKQGEEFRLHIVNGKLISQPGTVDFIHGINEIEFDLDDDIVYMTYEKEGMRFEWPIAYYHPQ